MSLPIDAIKTHLMDGFDQSVERLAALLRIPSIGTDPAYQAETLEAANWLVQELSELGFVAGLRATAGQPAVVAHHPGPGGDGPQVLYYGHYDVQPAEPLDLWTTPPFEPAVVNGPRGKRIVARGAVDNKGQSMMFIEAFRAWKNVHGTLPVAVTVFLEGEEESGSPSLDGFLEAHKHELQADVCVVSDTNMWDIDTPALGIMLRGLLYLEVTLHGPSQDLHSGLYGGAVPNPLNILTSILGDLHDEKGRVQIPDFYNDLEDLGELDQAWQSLAFDEGAFLKNAGLSQSIGEVGYSTLQRIWSRPTCDINGLFGGYTGAGAKTVIPEKASAKLSCRLVPGQDASKIKDGFRSFFEARLPVGCLCDLDELGAAPALKVSTESPYLKAAEAALVDIFGRAPILVGMGGSIPAVGAIREHLGIESILMGFGLDDDRVHAPDEKFELRCFQNGMLSHAALLEKLAR